MDVCRNAAPHVVPCVVLQLPWKNDTVHYDRTCGCQCRDLRLDALAVCGDSRIAVHHAHMMHISFV